MKKLCIGIDASNLLLGGGQTHIIELLTKTKKNNFRDIKIIIWGGKNTLQIMKNQPFIKKISPSLLNFGLMKRIIWQIFFFRKEALREKCDILLMPGGINISNFSPSVTMSRNLLPFRWSELFRFGFSPITLRLIFLRFIQIYSFQNSDAVIFLSKYARQTIEKITGPLKGSVKLIPHGINKKFKKIPRKQFPISNYSVKKKYRIIYVSSVSLYKHQWNVVEAIGKLRKINDWPIQLDLVGPADNSSAFAKLKNAMDYWDPNKKWVKYIGPINYDKLNKVYRKSDMGLFASSCENLPNTLIEMMSMGLPIVSSKHNPMREILKNSGIYFDPENSKDIVIAVEKLIKSPKLRKKNSHKSFYLAKKYSWNKCQKDTFNFLKHVAKKKYNTKKRY